MKIVILGGQGFIGHNLTSKLKEYGHHIVVVTNKIDESRIINGVEYVEIDITKLNEVEHIFEQVDLVYHLISTTVPTTSNRDIEFDISSNLIATVKLLEICVKCEVEKVIFTSSGGAIYGNVKTTPITEEHDVNPISSYGVVKLAIEKYLFMYHELYGLKYTVLRVANPYGLYQQNVGQGIINVYLRNILQGKAIEVWSDLKVTKDYIYIDDLVDAMVMSIKENIVGVYNVGSGTGHSIQEIIEGIEEVVGDKIEIVYKNKVKTDVSLNILDITKFREASGWKPKVTLNLGIRQLYKWLKDHECK